MPKSSSIIDKNANDYNVENLRKMKSGHENNISMRMVNQETDFFIELQKIFQKYKFDMIFLQQNFTTPFYDSYFECSDFGVAEIRDSLNHSCSLQVDTQVRRELCSLAQLIEATMLGVAINSNSNGNGIAIPSSNHEKLEAITTNVQKIGEIYSKYRYG